MLFSAASQHTQIYIYTMHADALTCGDRAVGGWVKSVEWAADRRPCALLTDWRVKGADSTSCWRKDTNRHKKKKKKEKVKLGSIIISSEWKVLGIITTQMEYSKRHTISRTATIMSYSTLLWAKKRLKIMRRESGCCVLSSIPLTGQGKFLFLVAIRTDRMVGVVRVQNSRAIMWNILWERGWGSLCCCDCQSDGKELTSLLLRPAAHCFYTQQDSQSPQLFRRNKVEKCSNISYLNQLFVHVMY